jgi:hypothetical protein
MPQIALLASNRRCWSFFTADSSDHRRACTCGHAHAGMLVPRAMSRGAKASVRLDDPPSYLARETSGIDAAGALLPDFKEE